MAKPAFRGHAEQSLGVLLNYNVEAVEKVPPLRSRHDDGKIDLSECAVFDDRGPGAG